jgi:hypothetical protein
MTTRDNILERIRGLGSLNGRNDDILQQLTALKTENVNMIQAMVSATALLGTLIGNREQLDAIIASVDTSYGVMNDNVGQILDLLQGAPTTAELIRARTALEEAIANANRPDNGSQGNGPPSQIPPNTSRPRPPGGSLGQNALSGGYSYKPYNSKRPGSYKASMKKSKKKYSKRKKPMTK